MLGELRRALRTLRREPGFLAAAVVTLSLGIGANSSMFGVVDALLFQAPPGVGEPASLFRVETMPDPTAGEHTFFLSGFSRGDLAAFVAPSSPFAEAAAYTDREVTVGDQVSVRKTPALLVGGNYFRVLRASVALGRPLLPADDAAGAPTVAVVSDAFWRRSVDGDRATIGRAIHIGGHPVVAGVARPGFVGIVRNMRSTSLTSDDGPFVYLPFTAAAAFSVFGIAALVLASVGVYAVIAYPVAQRTREVGIRMALGAVQLDVVRLVVAQGARVAAIGLAVGFATSVAVAAALRTKLYGVSTVDPLTYVAVAALLTLAALVASWLPAHRAARVDPAVALRAE